MYLARERIIKKQILINKNEMEYNETPFISLESLNLLEAKAHDQLSMQKVISREIDYHQMETFLLMSNEERKKPFYQKVSSNLRDIFNNQKAKNVFDEKWTHTLKSNIMGLFNQIVLDYFQPNSQIREQFNPLYFETIQKLMKDERLSRIQEKFIDPFLTETMRQPYATLDILGSYEKEELNRHSIALQKVLNTKETPKSLTNSQYLQYSVFSLLGLSLPHEKYLYNQLLHAPNPKYLFPFRKKGTFIALTHEILAKSNRTDMVGFKYWNYYEYEESDAYERVRKAAEWETKIIPLAIILKKKVYKGLERYMNLIDEKIRLYNNRGFEEDGVNLINSYVELCLQICENHFRRANDDGERSSSINNNSSVVMYGSGGGVGSQQFLRQSQPQQQQQFRENRSGIINIGGNGLNKNSNKTTTIKSSFTSNNRQHPQSSQRTYYEEEDLSTILERVDISTAFQIDQTNNRKHEKLRYFTTKLTELYFILLTSCNKGHLREKFIVNFSYNIEKILECQSDRKFTEEITSLSLRYLAMLSFDERQLFIYSILERVNEQWENEQSVRVNNEISKIDTEVLEFISFVIEKYGLDDNNDPTKKSSKLEFFYILALNFNENSYFESKKRLSKVQLTINTTLANNPIFDTLQTRKLSQEKFKSHLTQLYGKYELDKKEHEGVLAIVDEILTYRIQISKDVNDYNEEIEEGNSFYSVLINFLEESERLDPTKKLLKIVRSYCNKCKRTYFIEVNQMKFKDETKKKARKLITQDVSFLIEASISSNPIIAEFSQEMLFEYISGISELALYTRVLIVFAECITILYKKASIEYESKAEILKGKHLTSSILIPTDNKVILKRLTKIMIALYKIVLKGHCIDDNYMRVKVGYLIKEHSKSAKTPFGWKYLKYLINNFKEDKEFIGKEILTNNSCSWFINESYFEKKVAEMRPEKLLLDKYLLPLHTGDCSTTELKKLMTNIDLQEETEFLIVPSKTIADNSFSLIIKELDRESQKLQRIQLSFNHENASAAAQAEYESIIENAQNRLYDVISRIKMTYINKLSQIEIFSSIFEVCQKYNNAELLKYTLLKIVPFIYCINEFNERILLLISEMLYYVVNELNKTTKFIYNEFKSDQTNNTFDLLLDCFQGIDEYEVKEHSHRYEQLFRQVTSLEGNNETHTTHTHAKEEKSYRFMIIKFYGSRLMNLKRMFKELQKFLSDHMHVCIGKAFSLTLIVQIFSINFILEDYVMEFLHLESICYCLTSQLELVNVLKSSLEKGHTPFEERSLVEGFEMQTLKMGLNHFQRRHNFYKEELLNQTHNIKSLNTKIDFLIQICDYLRNEDFHEIKKKRLPKRNDKVLQRKKKEPNLFSQIADEGHRRNNFARSYNEKTSLASEQGEHYEIRKTIGKIEPNPDSEYYDPGALRFTLLYLISEQIDKTKAYSFSELSEIENPYSLAKKKRFVGSEMILSTYNQMGESNILIFNILKIFGGRIDNPEEIERKLATKISEKPDHGFPEFLEIFVEQNKSNKEKIKEINFWKSPNVQILFKYLSKDYEDYPYLQQYVTKVLSRLQSEQILFYLPQIFQTLTLKTGEIIYNFLLEYARNSASFAHQLIWIAKVESKQEKDPHNKNPRLPGVDKNLEQLQIIAKKLIKDILRQFTKEEKIFFREVNDFYEEVTAISGIMKPTQTKDVKRDVIRQEVDKIVIPESAYLPINPVYKVVDIDKDSGMPMQSAAKTPFLLTFRCKKYEGPDQDFENRKKLKKFQNESEFEKDFEDISRDEEIPNKLPVFHAAVHGSRARISVDDQKKPNPEKNKHNKVSFSSQLMFKHTEEIDLNDIKMEVSETESKQQIYRSKESQSRLKGSSFAKNLSSNTNNNNNNNASLTDVSMIFKVFDDIRQDCLALQVIRLFSEIFERHKLELKLFSYKTISNRTGEGLDIGGIIEVVPKTVSRDGIGKTNEESLYEFFISNFGPEYNIRFQEARENFIKSQAAYSVISYILQIKDRHNGNILINTEEGYLIHIDFGFIFDISPANNLKFERADFKLTEEMIKIMGGSLESEPFQLYLNLVIKGFLICRRYAEHIINIIKQMYDSGLPCFLTKSIENLRARFVLEMSEIQAAEYMKDIVYKAADSWYTNWYDKIQWIQQKIYH